MKFFKYFTVFLILSFFVSSFSYADDVKISGKVYYQYLYDSTKDAEDEDKGKFDITRVYVTLKKKLDEKTSMNVTTDVGRKMDTNNHLVTYVKYAYLNLKVAPNTSLLLGQAGMPWIGFVEKKWGYRYVSGVLADVEKVLKSADMGIHLKGKLLQEGNFEYQISYVNGEGYHDPDTDRFKDLQLRATLNLLESGVSISALYNKGQEDTAAKNTRDRYGLLLAYKGEIFSVGGEYLNAKDGNTKKGGFSIFGRFIPTEDTSVFARYDVFDLDKDTADNSHKRFILGVEKKLAKGVSAALDYQGVDYDDTGTTDTKKYYLHFEWKF
jgi:hypothetical protein